MALRAQDTSRTFPPGFRTFVPLRLIGPFLIICLRIDKATRNPRNPRNIPEISPVWTCKKASVFAALRKISPISPISPGCRGCVCLARAFGTPGRSQIRPRNPREIHKISTSHKTRKPAQMLAFLKISTKSTKSTGCHGRVSHALDGWGYPPRAGLHGSRHGSRKTHAVRRGRFC